MFFMVETPFFHDAYTSTGSLGTCNGPSFLARMVSECNEDR